MLWKGSARAGTFRGPEADNGLSTVVACILSAANTKKTELQVCTLKWPTSLQFTTEFYRPGTGFQLILINRYFSVQWYNCFIPPKRPLLLHLLAVNLHIKQPTAEPVEWLASYCWGHNPFSPALYPGKAGHDRCHGVKENTQWLKILNKLLTSNKPFSGCSNTTFQHILLISDCC